MLASRSLTAFGCSSNYFRNVLCCDKSPAFLEQAAAVRTSAAVDVLEIKTSSWIRVLINLQVRPSMHQAPLELDLDLQAGSPTLQ